MKGYKLHELKRISRIALLLCVILLIGCKTAKNSTKSDTKQNSNVQLNQSSDFSSITSGSAVLDIQSNVKTDELTNFSGSYTKWSKPDSTGKQHPEITGTYTGSKQSKTNDQTKTNLKQDNSETKELTTAEKINAIMGVQTKTQEKTTSESKAPIGVSWGIVILTVGLLVLLYFVLKRFGAIK